MVPSPVHLSVEAHDANSAIRRSMSASAVNTSTASAARLQVLAHLASKLVDVRADAGQFLQSSLLFRRFPHADARAGLADVIRHAHAMQSGVEAENVALLRVHAHDHGGAAHGLDAPHRFPCLWAFQGSKGQRPLPAVRLYAQRIDET